MCFLRLVLLLVSVLLLFGCDGRTYTEVTEPDRSSSQAEVDEWETAQTKVYERGYRDGRDENCAMYKRFLDGQVSMAYAERALTRLNRERANAYESSTLAALYREGWKDGADSLSVAFMGVDPC